MSLRRSLGAVPAPNREEAIASSTESSRLSSPPSTVRIGAATSQVRPFKEHLSPLQYRLSGDAPALGSVSNASQHAIEQAMQATSRGVHISPLSTKSAGKQRALYQNTTGFCSPYKQGVEVQAPRPTAPYYSELTRQPTGSSSKRELSFSRTKTPVYTEPR